MVNGSSQGLLSAEESKYGTLRQAIWNETSGLDGSGYGVFAQRLCEDADDDGVCDIAPEAIEEIVADGETATTDTEADGATPADPIETTITSPNGGTISITETLASLNPAVFEVDLTAPAASVDDPLIIEFRIDSSLAGAFTVLKNGASIDSQCNGDAGTATPDPCIASFTTLQDGDLLMTALSSTASLWNVEPALACGATPATAGCTAAAKAKVDFNEKKAGKEKVKLQWKKLADATTQAGFGDPVEGTTTVALCVYDDADALVAQMLGVNLGEGCAGNACWKVTGTVGYAYKDKANSSDGLSKLGYKSGDAGKGKADSKGKNNEAKGQVTLPTEVVARLTGNTAPTIQMLTSEGLCISATMNDVKKDEPTRYMALLK